MASSILTFYVNGVKRNEANIDPRLNLLSYLRTHLGLKGTKESCGLGACGSCTVLVSKFNHATKTIRHFAVTACLVPIAHVHSCAITTVEGIGSTRTKVHAIQEQLALGHGTQCGFCSPGMVMSMYALLRRNPRPSDADIERALEGNLCRCTGYRPIIDSFRTFSEEYKCPMGEECCQKSSGQPVQKDELLTFAAKYDSSQEPIFPSELQLSDTLSDSLVIQQEGITWYVPRTVDEVLDILEANKKAVVIAGNTALQEKCIRNQCLVSLCQVNELQYVRTTSRGLEVGAGTSISQLEEHVTSLLKQCSDIQRKTMNAICNMTRTYASEQIRSQATVGGSIMADVTWSDIQPLLLALGAEVTVSCKGKDPVNLSISSLFQNKLEPGRLVISVTIPFLGQEEVYWQHKECQRRGFDTSVLSLAAKTSVQAGAVQSCTLVLGGLTKTPLLLTNLASHLQGRTMSEDFLSDLNSVVQKDLPEKPSEFQQLLIRGILLKCVSGILAKIDNQDESTEVYELPPRKSVQVFDNVPTEQTTSDSLGRPILHLSALEHTTGEAQYITDMPKLERECHLALVTSTKAHARIVRVDPSEALKIPGVVGFISHHDIPGINLLAEDEEIFAETEVTCVGQTIGAIVAEDKRTATVAAYSVLVEYQPLKPVITSIQDAIAHNSYSGPPTRLVADQGETNEDEVNQWVEGEVHIGGQEHFYMETHVTLAVPRAEKGEMDVYTGGQFLTIVQKTIAECLGVPMNKITVKSKRIGGAFGGKNSRNMLVAVPCAVAAYKFQRPVRCSLYRKQDMAITGGRMPALAKYKVGVSKDGRLQTADLKIFGDGGNTPGSSVFCTKAVAIFGGGCYFYPRHEVEARACKTNLPTNTATRGFGIPQATFIGESILAHVAAQVKLPLDQVQEKNLLRDGHKMFFDMTLEHCYLKACWEECKRAANFEARKVEIEKFNRQNKVTKRGIALTPIRQKAGIAARGLSQASALVQVYAGDGSVLLHTGGIEMGQGLYTKMIQIASRELGIPMENIHISETRTDAMPNCPQTAASHGSDINGLAVKDACEKLMKTLAPYKKANPTGTWTNWVTAAFADQACLAAVGHGRVEDMGIDPATGKGRLFMYCTYGVACSEVQIDCLTGSHQVLRTDIVIDLGKSLNPAVDIGQVEGSFVQGYGLYMLEEIVYDKNGRMTTCGPERYKIPTLADVPPEFNVTLLRGTQNPRGVYSSRSAGEAPLLMGLSVFSATREAIVAARADRGRTGHFRLDSPATAQRILLAINH